MHTPPTPRKLTLSVGVLSQPLGEQLAEQGLALSSSRLGVWAKRIEGLGFLYMANLVTEGERDRIANRIVKAIASEVEQESSR